MDAMPESATCTHVSPTSVISIWKEPWMQNVQDGVEHNALAAKVFQTKQEVACHVMRPFLILLF